jgi:hypothetical protein
VKKACTRAGRLAAVMTAPPGVDDHLKTEKSGHLAVESPTIVISA